MNRKDFLAQLSTIIVTVLIPVALSGAIGLLVENKPLIIGINAALAAALGIIRLSGVMPRLIFAHHRRYVEAHLKKAIKRLKKLAGSYHSGVYNYGISHLKELISTEEYGAFLAEAAKNETREDKKGVFQQLIVLEASHEKH